MTINDIIVLLSAIVIILTGLVYIIIPRVIQFIYHRKNKKLEKDNKNIR